VLAGETGHVQGQGAGLFWQELTHDP
jgi:hypothetical protein